ncbi:MAG: hypothetical protein WBM35_13895 [Candidatus Electrothrix sp.]
MEIESPFIIGVVAVVLGIITLKVFFTLWKLIDKRLHPDDFDKPENTPETAFRGLKKKSVNVYLKNGDVLTNHKYKKTLMFGDGEFAAVALLYFELTSPEGNGIFVCGSDITRIETCKEV